MEGRPVRRDTYLDVDVTGDLQWKPVLAGTLIGFAVTILLTTLGAAIGITAGDAAGGADAEVVGTGALIWGAFTVIAAGLAGGWTIARTARPGMYYDALIYGALAWVLGAIVLLFLLAIGVGAIIGGLGGGLGAAAAERGVTSVSPADTARIAEKATDVGKGTAWGLMITQLLGLGASIVGARMRGRGAVPDRTVAAT